MEKKKITFVSSRGRGFDTDLYLLKNKLAHSMKQVSFRYFIKQEITENAAYAAALKAAKTELCKDTDHIVCADMSINFDVDDAPEEQKRVLMHVPYNYLHDAMLNKQINPKAGDKVGCRKFTHVYPTSPFGKELLEQAYDMSYAQMVDGYCAPMAYDINRPETIAEAEHELYKYYPQARGKKILAFVVQGKLKDEEKWFYNNLDIKAFLDNLGDDWFMLTNSKNMLESFAKVDSSYVDRFGFTADLILARHIVCVSDVLVTNLGAYAACQASKRKPFLILYQSDNRLEQFFARNEPAMFIDSKEKFMNMLSDIEKNRAIHEKAQVYFSYPPDRDMTEHICELLKE